MPIPTDVSHAVQHRGPAATVYLDTTRGSEHGAHEVELRWRELRGELDEQGCDGTTLATLDAAVAAHRDPAPGRVLAAAGQDLLLDRALPSPPRAPLARWSAVPHLVPYLAQRGPAVPHVVVVADRGGADLISVRADDAAAGAHPDPAGSVTGRDQYPLTKTSVRDWSEQHFQQRVENSWTANARDVADAAARLAVEIDAALVVLAGDPHALGLLRDDLPAVLPQRVRVADVDPGGRGAGASADALWTAVRDEVLHTVWHERREMLELLQRDIGRHEYAVTGTRDVLTALRRGQAETVVLSDDPSSTLTAWIGPEPAQVGLDAAEVSDLGVAEPVRERYDAALLRAVAGTGADIVITPNAHDFVRDGVAATLRYVDEATPSP